MSKQYKLTPIAFALTFAAGASLAANTAEQLPATPHQAEVIDEIKPKSVDTPTAAGLPASPHQEDVLKAFDSADKDGDGALSREEYQNMQSTAAQNYNKSLHATEQHGADASGPRDRQEEEGRSNPVQ